MDTDYPDLNEIHRGGGTLCQCPYCLCTALSVSAVEPVQLCITPATETDRGTSNTAPVLKRTRKRVNC